MEDDFNYLLSQAQVPPQQLTNDPILKFDYFEFKDNKYYQPVLLRILLNSINIFNYAFDKNGEQSTSLPISIQKVKDEKDSLSLIMHTKTNVDILNEVLANRMELFSDLDESIKNKIDINFEKDLKNLKKSTEEIHKNYMDGFLYENNCVKKFLSYFEDKEITVLPNLFFYIKSNYVEQISNSIGLDCSDLLNQINNQTTRGFPRCGWNELDLLFKLNESKPIKVLKNDFTLVNCFINNQSQKNDNLTFEKGDIFGVEIKLNSAEITNDVIEKTYNKGNLLRESLFNQGFIKDKCPIKVINIGNFSKSKISKFSPYWNTKNIDTYLFFGDVAINHTTLFSLNKRIETLESSHANLNEKIVNLTNEMKDLKESISQLTKGETKNGLSENAKKIPKGNKVKGAKTKIFSLFENYKNDLKNETLQLEVEKILLELLD